MTFSYGLVLALFLFAPGFAAYAGLFYGTQHTQFRPAPPAPGSFIALGIVVIGALVAHAVGGALFAGNEFWCGATGACLAVDSDPNPYTAILSASAGSAPMRSYQVLGFLVLLLGLSALMFWAVSKAVRAKFASDQLAGLLYGWLADMVRLTRSPNRFVSCFVLTDVKEGGFYMGYEGLLKDMTLNSEKELTSLYLSDVMRFHVQIGEGGPKRRTALDDDGNNIPSFYIERSQIKNIAFNVFEAREEAQPG